MPPPSDANPGVPPDPDAPTSTVTDLPAVLAGRYELGPVLGRGGTATVFRARDRVLDRTVALKVFGQGVLGPDERRQDHEIRALAHLSHPGLVALFDAGTDDGRAYLAMQLVEGETLADRIRRGPLSVEATLGIGTVLADALTYVHSQGVVHRDLKPANVLLDADGRPLITDFGIARLVDTTRVTATGYLVGTASYLAPEQVRGQVVGPAADIFALGLVLLECLTGRREYPGGVLEAAVARLHRPPEIPPDLPPTLATLLHGMTASEPADRPTAAEVAHTLGAAAAQAPTSRIGVAGAGGTIRMPAGGAPVAATQATPAGAAEAAAPPTWHRRAVLTAAGSVVALLVLVVAVLAARNLAEPPPAPPSLPPVSQVPPPPTSERTKNTEEASTAKDEPSTTEQTGEPTTGTPGPTQPPAPPPPPPNNSPEQPTPSDSGGASGQGGGPGDQGGDPGGPDEPTPSSDGRGSPE